MAQNQNKNNSIQHGLEAASANATNSEEQQQVQQLSEQVQNAQLNVNAAEEENVQ
ncbi:hypothetical protein DFP93_101138 [Aneurinibacillus soli]|uniref:Uncharacterized protein n=1 Tax=Aneurinibacillus soli TaxID=1500254 RepID=A0A0U5BIR0_9BACL|nr:hypothetical protein [Aneurinibacillus soli]PYE64113.1 hypothetical protein DFP93_101138 [Aneurinibacillus soli]BAU28062.1 hypothetical protein CB4_02236 [Aneurinibacillus soli]